MDNHDAGNDVWAELFGQIGGDDHQYYGTETKKSSSSSNNSNYENLNHITFINTKVD